MLKTILMAVVGFVLLWLALVAELAAVEIEKFELRPFERVFYEWSNETHKAVERLCQADVPQGGKTPFDGISKLYRYEMKKRICISTGMAEHYRMMLMAIQQIAVVTAMECAEEGATSAPDMMVCSAPDKWPWGLIDESIEAIRTMSNARFGTEISPFRKRETWVPLTHGARIKD